MKPRQSWFREATYPFMRELVYYLFTAVPYAPVKREFKERVPAEARIIWAPTHSNFLSDVTAIGYEGKIPPRFIAKHTLFVFPIHSFVKYCGAVPVVRFDDVKKTGGNRSQNRRTFVWVINAMIEGWPVAIFPEGVSVPGPGLVLPLKPGVAKLAFAAEQEASFKLNVVIMPVGFEYGARKRIGSGLTIRFGNSIRVADYRKLYEEQPDIAVAQVMERLTAEMTNIFPHFESVSDFDCGVLMDRAGVANSRWQASQFFKRLTTEDKNVFKLEFAKFVEATKAQRLALKYWGQARQWQGMSLLRKVGESFCIFLGIPLVVWHVVNNFVAELIVILVADQFSKDVTEFMTVRMLVAPFVLLPIFAIEYFALAKLIVPSFVVYVALNLLSWYGFKRWLNAFGRAYGWRKLQMQNNATGLWAQYERLLQQVQKQ